MLIYIIYIELVLVVWEDKGDIASKRVCFPRVHMFLLLWCIAYLIYIYILHLFKVFKHAVVVSANCLCSQTSYWYSLRVQTISSNYSSARNCNSSYTVPSKGTKLVGGLVFFWFFHRQFHHPNWRTHISQRGRLNHQPENVVSCFFSVEGLQRHFSLVFPGWSVPRPPVTFYRPLT